jgi:dUTP pyrophosphatase
VPYPDGSVDYAPIEIPPNETRLIPTGIAIAIPEGYWGGIYARSGLAAKQGLRPANCVGVIDSDYRGEIFVALHNDSNNYRYVNNGDRIAQLVFHQCWQADGWTVVEKLDTTDRGNGGFGSTGK